MEKYIQKVKAYITGQFNHFSKVTGYATKVDFEVTPDEDKACLDVCVEINGLEWSQVSHTSITPADFIIYVRRLIKNMASLWKSSIRKRKF